MEETPIEELAMSPEAKKLLKLQGKKDAKALKKSKTQSKISMLKKRQQSDDDDHDPYMSLGFGLISYRNTLWTLTILFVVLSAVAFPLI